MALKEDWKYEYMNDDCIEDDLSEEFTDDDLISQEDPLEIEQQDDELIRVFHEMKDWISYMGLDLLEKCTIVEFMSFANNLIFTT